MSDADASPGAGAVPGAGSESGAVSEAVRYEVSGHVAVITLNRPAARNAVNHDVAVGLESAIDALENDPDVWVGVLCANSDGQARPVFCAGADLKAIEAGQLDTLMTARGGFAGFVFRERAKPVVVAVDGLATAGGLEIVLAADLVVASTRSAFGLAEVKRNLVASSGGLFRLPRAIGQAAALDAILTGEPLEATRAFALGLVSRLVEPGEALTEALRLAEQIAAAAPLAVRASRRIVRAAATTDDDTLRAMCDQEFRRLLDSEDTKEGLAAFIEKRSPRWSGR
ncbi:enoyl-CoA hydratase-related protein [Pseudofrankia asymbiotica]|uniref:enoyl-CoA hydratase-related protein n=1 Tax=Pseudofrankia asymbiotica TaxID=1834516 RepID=UPI0009D738A5|nr:enoyl-CoA hydratase-related protein [Pseudofrankia asymbiotica]